MADQDLEATIIAELILAREAATAEAASFWKRCIEEARPLRAGSSHEPPDDAGTPESRREHS